ncbi:MAG: phosphoribosylglycinamide formyltransferase [Cyclobacteriaceae bacterium]|nr:phosphoribosylglycinamide formyltransferase [Cyclobacteriaceae bacterium]
MSNRRLAVFASGNGTNAEAIMKHFQHHSEIIVGLVLSNNPHAGVLERAKKFDVSTRVFNREQFREGKDVMASLEDQQITHVILAGFLWLIPPYLIEAYPGHIINIHPSLLPQFGGKGMYGQKVHEAVKASGEKQTGITIHLVNERFDEGKIIFQAACAIDAEDTVDTIAEKVHQLEHRHFPAVIEEWVTKA